MVSEAAHQIHRAQIEAIAKMISGLIGGIENRKA
jgi:hypothetical protein